MSETLVDSTVANERNSNREAGKSFLIDAFKLPDNYVYSTVYLGTSNPRIGFSFGETISANMINQLFATIYRSKGFPWVEVEELFRCNPELLNVQERDTWARLCDMRKKYVKVETYNQDGFENDESSEDEDDGYGLVDDESQTIATKTEYVKEAVVWFTAVDKKFGFEPGKGKVSCNCLSTHKFDFYSLC